MLIVIDNFLDTKAIYIKKLQVKIWVMGKFAGFSKMFLMVG